MTGGTEKIFGGVQINFTLIFEGENQKKVFNRAVDVLSGQSRLGGRRGTAESNGADLASCPQIQEERPKKRSSARNLRLSLSVHTCFSSWNKILFTLSGAQAVFWGGTGPVFFGAQPSLGGNTSRLEGTSSNLGGSTAPKCPPVQSCKSARAFRVGFGLGPGSGRVRA